MTKLKSEETVQTPESSQKAPVDRRMVLEKLISKIAIFYFLFGIVFAICFALFYHWDYFGFFSPGFWSVVLFWPFQVPGFTQDLMRYGLAGKPV